MEPIGFQVTVDAADPHAQARFWAAALGYVVEDNDAFIRDLLEQGHVGDEDVIEVDGRLSFAIGEAIRHPDDLDADPLGDPAPRRLLFLHVPEEKVGKNRLHLDLNVGVARIDAEVARLLELGASELYRVDEPASVHATLADPEGNEFCVQ